MLSGYACYVEPTYIRCAAILAIIKGRDILSTEKIRLGEIVAFVLPILQQLEGTLVSSHRESTVLV